MKRKKKNPFFKEYLNTFQPSVVVQSGSTPASGTTSHVVKIERNSTFNTIYVSLKYSTQGIYIHQLCVPIDKKWIYPFRFRKEESIYPGTGYVITGRGRCEGTTRSFIQGKNIRMIFPPCNFKEAHLMVMYPKAKK